MIGSLKGKVDYIDGQSVLVDVSGVGYLVFVSSSFLEKINKDDEIKIYVHTHVREDLLELFGFESIEDLKLFNLLISVNGVGPKTALGIFSIGKRTEILNAIQKADVKFFTAAPRLGTKNAQKIIIDLKNKIGSIVDLDLTDSYSSQDKDIEQALRGFGFKDKEIYQALKEVGTEKESGKKLKLALKYLGKK